MGRQPAILVAVEHQEADASGGVVAQSREGAEHHGAVAANHQEPVAVVARAERRLARGLNKLNERSLVQQPGGTTDAVGILKTKVTEVDDPERAEPRGEATRAQDVDPTSDAARQAH